VNLLLNVALQCGIFRISEPVIN